jgi:hypothetical protein
MSLRCDRWQGWGDPRVRVFDALHAATALRQRGVLGVDKFIRTCESIGAYEYALVPPAAIDQLVIDNVDILVLDTKSRAFWRWAGLDILPSFGEKAIRCAFLKDVYIAYRRLLPRWNKYAPVTLTLRAALSGMLRGGQDATTVQAAAASIADEMGCSVYGTMTSPRIRWAFKLLALAIFGALVVRAALLAASIFFSVYYAIATTVIHTLMNVDVASLPWKFIVVSCAAFGATVANSHFRGRQFAKAATTVQYAMPIYALCWTLM